ncbi:hypothetical protein [Kiloniella sp.]|uniref:hypothetical protein n=1 Tax=Kiloniella sp. TaxID=1938587 RepID=UPI003A8CBE15
MIIKASQRGGSRQLGLHLLKTKENEHVEIHEIRGFMADSVLGTMKEAQAIAMGTKCQRPENCCAGCLEYFRQPQSL